MSYVALAMGVAAVGTGIYSANQSSKSAKQQAAGEQKRLADMRKLFGERDPGAGAMGMMEEQLAALMGINFDIDPMDYQEAGEELTRDAMDLMREQAELTFNQTVGASNLDTFNSFLSDNLQRANFDFSSLPAEITRTLEGSALSRAIGGPAGMAENLSVQNKLRLQQQSEQSAFKALGFRQGFMPDLLNPINSIMDLAAFERQNRLSQAQVIGTAAGITGNLANLEMGRFQLEAGYQPLNMAGIGAAANASMANTIGQSLGTLASVYGAYNTGRGNSYGAQGTPAIAGSYQQPAYSTQYPNPFPGNTSTTYPTTVYSRG